MSTNLVHRNARGRVVWTPELVAHCSESFAAGESCRDIAGRLGVQPKSLARYLPHGTWRQGNWEREDDDLPLPPVPQGRPALPCGCRCGEPCQRAQALKLAYEAETFGTRAWATKRQEWLRHVSGDEARREQSD